MAIGQIMMAAAVAYMPYPVPPAPPSPGSEAFERDMTNIGERLKEECYSDKGIALWIAETRRIRIRNAGRSAANTDAAREVAEAAYGNPFDPVRMERALRAQAALQASADKEREEDSVARLRLLPPADAILYARSIAGVQPMFPKRCSKAP